MCSLVFFKHKYLMMPSLTPADALIRAADDLTTALAGVIPPPSMTTNTIAQLINIFKTQAEKEKDKATLQRVLRENAQAERVLNETMALTTSPTNKPVDGPTSPQTNTTTTYPPAPRKGRRHTTRNTEYQSRRQPQLVTTISQHRILAQGSNNHTRLLISRDGHVVSPTTTIVHQQTSQLMEISTAIPL
jgi:hypothetical protein